MPKASILFFSPKPSCFSTSTSTHKLGNRSHSGSAVHGRSWRGSAGTYPYKCGPSVMDAHRIVGGDGTVDEAPLGFPKVFLAELVEDTILIPEFEDRVFALDKR